MAITSVTPFPIFSWSLHSIDVNAITLDATGESCGVIGRVWIEGAPGGTKTISAAGGGSIFVRFQTLTLSDGASVFDVGIQDVDTATGLEDGTFDVSGSWTSAAAPTANAWNKKVMGTGSKTLSHLDRIAIVANFTTRAGADTINLRRFGFLQNALGGEPYGSADTGALSKQSTALMAMILFDDGTRGWILGMNLPREASSINVDNNDALDEYANCFTPQVPMQISAVSANVYNVASGDTYEIVLYSDPLGTPAVIETITVDPDLNSGTATAVMEWQPVTPVTLSAGTTYAVAVRPTSTNPITFGFSSVTVNDNAVLKAMSTWGTTAKVAARADQTGAFAEVQTYYAPIFGILVTGLDDGQNITVGAHQSQIIAPFRAAGY